MEEKIKQRLIGVLVFIGALFIVLPFLFHNPQPLAQKNLPTKIPSPPAAQSVTFDLPAIKTNVAQEASTPVITAPTIAALNNSNNVAPTTTTPAVAAAPATVTAQKTEPAPTPAAATVATQKVEPTSTPATPAVAPQQALKQPDTMSAATPVVNTAPNTTVKPAPTSAALAQNPEAWTIQLGVFSSRDNAKDLMMKLRKEHFDAYMRTVMHDKSKLTVIYVGPEINKQKIQLTQNNLKKQFHIKGVVRKYQL